MHFGEIVRVMNFEEPRYMHSCAPSMLERECPAASGALPTLGRIPSEQHLAVRGFMFNMGVYCFTCFIVGAGNPVGRFPCRVDCLSHWIQRRLPARTPPVLLHSLV